MGPLEKRGGQKMEEYLKKEVRKEMENIHRMMDEAERRTFERKKYYRMLLSFLTTIREAMKVTEQTIIATNNVYGLRIQTIDMSEAMVETYDQLCSFADLESLQHDLELTLIDEEYGWWEAFIEAETGWIRLEKVRDLIEFLMENNVKIAVEPNEGETATLYFFIDKTL